MMLGAVCVVAACFAGFLALIPTGPSTAAIGNELIRASTLSPVEWRLQQQAQLGWYQRWLRPLVQLWGHRLHPHPARLDPLYLTQAGVDQAIDGVELRVIRLMSALLGTVVGCIIALLLAGSLVLVPLLSWLGYIAPLRVIAARRRRRQGAFQRDLPEFIGMLRAFMAAGMPLERTLHVLSANSQPDHLLKNEIRAALARYGLGLSIDQALEEIGPRTGVDDLGGFLTALMQSKRSGSGLEATLRDQELMVRMNQRNRATAQAAAVSTKLLAVLGGIYLPEFVVLIVIPLFWGIMQRAFG
jgi:tight adherence protein C